MNITAYMWANIRQGGHDIMTTGVLTPSLMPGSLGSGQLVHRRPVQIAIGRKMKDLRRRPSDAPGRDGLSSSIYS